jgi:hypothetical protein
MPQPHYVSETQILHSVANNAGCRYGWTKSAQRKRALHRPPPLDADIRYLATNGHVTLEEYKKDTLWRVEGKDLDGNKLTMVCAVYPRRCAIKIVDLF